MHTSFTGAQLIPERGITLKEIGEPACVQRNSHFHLPQLMRRCAAFRRRPTSRGTPRPVYPQPTQRTFSTALDWGKIAAFYAEAIGSPNGKGA
jgi:hypothetical protein